MSTKLSATTAPGMPVTLMRWGVYTCFFFSGATAVIFEVLWSRQFVTIFGNSAYAISIVLCAYMAGLGLGVLLLTLLLGTPVLSLIGAIGVALTVGLRRGGMILSLLVLPLYVPVLIFASNAVAMAGSGLPIQAQLNILISFLFMAVFLAPWPTAAALKMSIN